MNRTHLAHQCALTCVPLHGVSAFRAPTHDVLSVATLLVWKLASKRQKYNLHSKWPSIIATVFYWSERSQGHSDSVCAGARGISYWGMGEWEHHILEEHMGWEILSWPSLETQSMFSSVSVLQLCWSCYLITDTRLFFCVQGSGSLQTLLPLSECFPS